MKKNKNSLIQSILSIVFSMILWLSLLVGLNTPISQLSDTIQLWIILVAFLFSIPGAIMAILAKKNNVENKSSVVRISAIGIIISAIDIFFFIVVMPLAISSTLELNFIPINYIYVETVFLIGIVVDIILIVIYCLTKPR